MAVLNIALTDDMLAVRTAFNTIATKVGDTDTPLGTSAADIIGAINEVHGEINTNTSNIATNTSNISTNTTAIGTLGSLSTAAKSNLVAALNEVYNLASASETNFINPISMDSTLQVDGVTSLDGGVNLSGGVTVTTILDQDNMASNSAVALATQQSIKAYVDSTVAAINAITVGGLTASQFLRADASDTFTSGFYLNIGSGEGAVRMSHSAGSNAFVMSPYDGGAWTTNRDLYFDADVGYWQVEGQWQVGDDLIVLGDTVQLANTATLGSGTEYMTINSGTNTVTLFANSLSRIAANATSVTINSTTANHAVFNSSGVTLASELIFSGGHIITGGGAATDFVIRNNAGETIEISGADETIYFAAGSSSRFYIRPAGCYTTTQLTVGGNINTTGNIDGPSTFTVGNGENESISFGNGTNSVAINTVAGNRIVVVDASSTFNNQIIATGGIDCNGAFNAADAGTATFGSVAVTMGGLSATTGTFTGAVSSTQYTTANITVGSSNITLPSTGIISNGAGESIEFESTSIDLKTGASAAAKLSIGTGTTTHSQNFTFTTGTVTFNNAFNVTSGNMAFSGSVGSVGCLSAGEYITFSGINETITCAINDLSKLQVTSSGATVTGTMSATVVTQTSDERLKKISYSIDNDEALDIVNILDPFVYTWNDVARAKDPSISDKEIAGLSFQQIERVFPEAAGPCDENGYGSVNYAAMIPLLVAAVKALSEKVDQLEAGM